MKWLRLLRNLFSDCPRVVMGYKCHSYLPDGCEACGRGAPKGQRNIRGKQP
jgi:hypothetical protein